MQLTKKPEFRQIVIAAVGVYLCTLALNLFNTYLLHVFPLPVRAVLMIVTYWAIGLVPLILMIKNKESVRKLIFTQDNYGSQILVGILLGLAMSLALTLVPTLCGLKDWVDSGTRYDQLWKFFYEFVHKILAVGLTEEFVFRGYLFQKLETLTCSRRAAIIVSSILFGCFHFWGLNIVQILMTGLLGVFWCVCRDKIKNCTLLSLIIAHGVYDAMIVVWNNIL